MKSIFTLSILLFSSVVWAQGSVASAVDDKPFVEVDISGSSGNYNGQTYTEMHLGVNLNFTDWLTWRNTGFKRFGNTAAQETTGLDSSLRLGVDKKFDAGAIKFFAGPGYRWASPSTKNALFAEAGATIQLGRVSFGAGAKYLRYDSAQFDSSGLETKRDDMNYFITVAGGAGLVF
jgi:hypothetical protein